MSTLSILFSCKYKNFHIYQSVVFGHQSANYFATVNQIKFAHAPCSHSTSHLCIVRLTCDTDRGVFRPVRHGVLARRPMSPRVRIIICIQSLEGSLSHQIKSQIGKSRAIERCVSGLVRRCHPSAARRGRPIDGLLAAVRPEF